MKNWSVIAFIAWSLRASVGLVFAISLCRMRSWWLARGRTWSLNATIAIDSRNAHVNTGSIRVRTRTPFALKAVISCSAAIRPKVYKVATSTAIGIVIATVNGSERTKNLPMADQGSPLPARFASWRATYCSMSSDVSADSANRRGPMCSRTT